MNLNNIDELADGLDDKNRSSTLKLIDLKTDNDMKEVIAKMDNMLAKIDAKFERIDEKFAHVEATIETKMNTIYWVIGVASAVLTLIITFKK